MWAHLLWNCFKCQTKEQRKVKQNRRSSHSREQSFLLSALAWKRNRGPCLSYGVSWIAIACWSKKFNVACVLETKKALSLITKVRCHFLCFSPKITCNKKNDKGICQYLPALAIATCGKKRSKKSTKHFERYVS